jgi:hypothetical protein
MAEIPTRHHFLDSTRWDFATYLRADAQARGIHLVQATPEEDRQFGIDDWLQFPIEGVVSVDWKTDHRAATTGNLAVELISNASLGKLGWVFTSQADYVTYLLPVPGRLLWFKTATLRAAAINWLATYPTRGAHNDNREDRFLYTTWNLTVPLSEVARLAEVDKPQNLLSPPPKCHCPSCISARAGVPDPAPTHSNQPQLLFDETDLV